MKTPNNNSRKGTMIGMVLVGAAVVVAAVNFVINISHYDKEIVMIPVLIFFTIGMGVLAFSGLFSRSEEK
jgi:hypothetical protein